MVPDEGGRIDPLTITHITIDHIRGLEVSYVPGLTLDVPIDCPNFLFLTKGGSTTRT